MTIGERKSPEAQPDREDWYGASNFHQVAPSTDLGPSATKNTSPSEAIDWVVPAVPGEVRNRNPDPPVPFT